MITVEQLKAIFPDCPDPDTWATALSAAWEHYGFGLNAKAGYCGIVGNETGGLVNVRRENMRYMPSQTWKFGPTRAARCTQFCPLDNNGNRVREDHGEAFANCVYAGIIGNGGMDSGDGWKYRGGGIIQLTGRANYKACGDALGIDLEANPDALTSDPNTSALAAAWFMVQYQPTIALLLESSDEADFLEAAGLVGWGEPAATERRLAYRRKALEVLK